MCILASFSPERRNNPYTETPRFPWLRLLAAFLVIVSGLTTHTLAQAGQPASPWIDTESASVRLIASTETVGNTVGEASQPLILGLEFQLRENWKIYWRSPGDAGYPPRADWSISENIDRVDMAWPAPVRFSILGFETLGYKEEVVFPLVVSPKVSGEPVTLAGSIDYLICSDICVPETVDLSLHLPVGNSNPSTFAHLINKYSVRVPGDGKGHGLSIDRLALNAANPAKPLLTVSASSMQGLPFDNPDVYLEGPDGMGFGQPIVKLGEDGLSITLNVPVIAAFGQDSTLVEDLTSAHFIVTLIDGERSAEQAMTIASVDTTQRITMTEGASDEPATSEFLTILGLAFLGGLILNLMPCVLPVLSIKLLGVVSHGGSSARTVRLSFLASALGIIVSFLVIAGGLIALKSAGATIGWGIQFQQPWFLAVMTLIVIVFACNLWGWFEVHLPTTIADAGVQVSHTRGMGGHFLTGMLATLLATPCSAPFLGTAVGFALARGAGDIISIFAVLGLGLATPYILVALIPRLATMLPKPGQWMVTLRRILGVALAGTAGWLLWVMSQQVGWTVTAISGVFIIGIMVVFYLLHFRQTRMSAAPAVFGIAFAIAAIAVPVLADMPKIQSYFGNEPGTPVAQSNDLDDLWQPFDRQLIGQLVAEGKTVFVDVTADWCITCKVNKSFVLAGSPVIEQLKSEDIIAMQADWTLPSRDISDYLASFSRYGIPFNAVYGPGTPEGVMLPELLSSDAVMQAIQRAADG